MFTVAIRPAVHELLSNVPPATSSSCSSLTVSEFLTIEPANRLADNGDFESIFIQKYTILSKFKKPIIIAECGISSLDSQFQWIIALKSSVSKFPLLKSVVYFDAQDGYAWIEGTKPNWSLSRQLLDCWLYRQKI
jgi:beta-mannanase